MQYEIRNIIMPFGYAELEQLINPHSLINRNSPPQSPPIRGGSKIFPLREGRSYNKSCLPSHCSLQFYGEITTVPGFAASW